MGTFDLEKKVTYNELAPSLQALLNRNEFAFSLIRALKSAKPGQDLKIDTSNRNFIGDDNFYKSRICNSTKEYNQVIAYGPTSQNEIKNNWKYYINNTLQNSKPSYNETNRTFTLAAYGNKTSYLSTKEYPFVEIWLKITCTNPSYNKEAGVLVSEITYNNEKFDLCIVRYWNRLSLVFNYLYNTSSNPMIEIASISTTNVPWNTGNTCHINFTKEYNRITFSCNDIGDSSLEQKYKVQYNYPNIYDKGNVPYNRKTYKTVLKALMRNNSRIGFVCNNYNGTFNVLDQKNLYDDDKIYHLKNYEVLMWDGQNLVARPDGFNCIANRSFMFDSISNNLYWLKYISHTYNITSSGIRFDRNIDSKSMGGQVIKLSDTNTMYPDDNFYDMKVTDNNLELQDMMLNTNKSDHMKEIFDSWDTFSIFHDQNTAITGPFGCGTGSGTSYRYNGNQERVYASCWSYSDLGKTIYNNGNTYPITGYRSTKSYTEYWIEYTIMCNDSLHSGTDYVGAIVSWMFDSSGNPHWIGIYRNNDTVNNATAYFGIVYDMFLPTQKIIYDISNEINDKSPSNKFCAWQGFGQKASLFVGKTLNTISAKTTNYRGVGVDPDEDWDYEFDWVLPTTKPSDWSNDMWSNVNKMMSGGQIGLWALSYSISIGIQKQYNVFNNYDIYALHLNKVYEQNGKTVDAPSQVYLYKPGEVYSTKPNTRVRIMKNGDALIYDSGTDNKPLYTFQVLPFKKNIGNGRKSIETYLRLTVNGNDIFNSEGIDGLVTYHIQYYISGSWEYPETGSMPEWVVKDKCENLLPKKSWLYNSTFKRLYFYDGFGNKYTKINAE